MTTLLPGLHSRVWHPELGPGEVRALVKPAQVFVRFDAGTECLTPAVNVRVGAVPTGEMRRFLAVVEGGVHV